MVNCGVPRENQTCLRLEVRDQFFSPYESNFGFNPGVIGDAGTENGTFRIPDIHPQIEMDHVMLDALTNYLVHISLSQLLNEVKRIVDFETISKASVVFTLYRLLRAIGLELDDRFTGHSVKSIQPILYKMKST